MNESRRVFRLTSLLLLYPDSEWLDLLELQTVVEELENEDIRSHLWAFLDYLKGNELDQLIEQYVNTFDFSGEGSLYLTYASYSEQRERGAALLSLKELYAETGLVMDTNELPDYLPVFLEFASIAPDGVLEIVLKEQRQAIQGMADKLQEQSSPYSSVLSACLLAIDLMVGGGLQ